MSLTKRLRVIWAALTQTWAEHQCPVCGQAWWSSALHPEPLGALCAECDATTMDQWVQAYQARTGQKEIA